MNKQSPVSYDVVFHTTRGHFRVRVFREWSPHAADRFFNLVSNGFYDDTRVYRVIPSWVVQFGVDFSREVSAAYSNAFIPDEPMMSSNKAGYVAFSAAYTNQSHATNRTTEIYINYMDNSAKLDHLGFAPFGRVTHGMDKVVRSFYPGYGEMQDACAHGFEPCIGPTKKRLFSQGNKYLDAEFPSLDKIFSAYVVKEKQRSESSWSDVLGLVLLGLCMVFTFGAIHNGGRFMACCNRTGYQGTEQLVVPRGPTAEHATPDSPLSVSDDMQLLNDHNDRTEND